MSVTDPSSPRDAADRAPVRDASAIRALAHPTRLNLIEALSLEGAATATRCAELIGESVASCSFHLRMLARHGFVERVPSEGRERPWRLVRLEQMIEPEQGDAAARQAAWAFDEAYLAWEVARLQTALRRDEAPPWRGLQALAGATVWVTPAELDRMNQELAQVVRRFTERVADARLRPAGSRAVRVVAATSFVGHLQSGGDE